MNKEILDRHINLRVSDKTYENCEKIAASYSMTTSAFARLLLINALDRLKLSGELPKIREDLHKKGSK